MGEHIPCLSCVTHKLRNRDAFPSSGQIRRIETNPRVLPEDVLSWSLAVLPELTALFTYDAWACQRDVPFSGTGRSSKEKATIPVDSYRKHMQVLSLAAHGDHTETRIPDCFVSLNLIPSTDPVPPLLQS